MPPERVLELDETVRSLLGFSIHPPFMGHIGGRHPLKTIRSRLGKP